MSQEPQQDPQDDFDKLLRAAQQEKERGNSAPIGRQLITLLGVIAVVIIVGLIAFTMATNDVDKLMKSQNPTLTSGR